MLRKDLEPNLVTCLCVSVCLTLALQLWWFDLAFVVISLLMSYGKQSSTSNGSNGKSSAGQQAIGRCGNELPIMMHGGNSMGGRASACPYATGASESPFTLPQALWAGAALVLLLTTLCFAVRISVAPWLGPEEWLSWGFVFNFEPSYMPQYVVCFALGICARKHNALVRLPASMTWWCLCFAALWWTAAWTLLQSFPGLVDAKGFNKRSPAAVGYWAFHTFVEQSFAVVWGAGLMLFFREVLNSKPGRLGVIITGAAYVAYLVHPVFVTLFGRAFAKFEFWSILVNAVVLSYLTVPASWLVAAGLKAIPGANKVL